MEKWADYLISAIRYGTDSNNRTISYFKIHTDNGESIGESRTWTREEVLKSLSQGNSFSTIRKDSNGKWIRGEEVSISRFKNIFIRSDFKNILGDYLENIPEF